VSMLDHTLNPERCFPPHLSNFCWFCEFTIRFGSLGVEWTLITVLSRSRFGGPRCSPALVGDGAGAQRIRCARWRDFYSDPFDPNHTAGKTCSFNIECGPGNHCATGSGIYGVRFVDNDFPRLGGRCSCRSAPACWQTPIQTEPEAAFFRSGVANLAQILRR